ncbi:hypothetical protein M885DRAFT_513369 [Pelagophyceae sp. CCMP2097]|nr:hypothetical protein M885DRAFT_513369 [Pelagophyceae sp. CCMP2097]
MSEVGGSASVADSRMSEIGDSPREARREPREARDRAPRERKKEAPSKTLLLTDLDADTQAEDVQTYFSQHNAGGFINSRVRKDRNGAYIGFADFETVEQAKFAHDTGAESKVEIKGMRPAFYFARSSGAPPPKVAQKRSYDDSFGGGGGERRAPPSSRAQPAYGSDQQHGQGYGGGPGYGQTYLPSVREAEMSGASSTLFVDNVPPDATLREVGHIFRQFPGFKSLRMKPPREGASRGPFCFVEFEAPPHALVALRAVNGYRFDHRQEADSKLPCLRLEFAKSSSRA